MLESSDFKEKSSMFQRIKNVIIFLPFKALDSDIGRSSPKAIVVKANTGKVLNAFMWIISNTDFNEFSPDDPFSKEWRS